MTAHTTVPALTEAQQVEAHLDAILTAIMAHDAQPRKPREPGDLRPINMADMMAALDARQTMTPAGRYVDDLERDPVRGALTYAVRQLGKRLYEIGGLQAMQDACDRVAELDQSNWGRRTSVMDARWDGIGREGGLAGWCS